MGLKQGMWSPHRMRWKKLSAGNADGWPVMTCRPQPFPVAGHRLTWWLQRLLLALLAAVFLLAALFAARHARPFAFKRSIPAGVPSRHAS